MDLGERDLCLMKMEQQIEAKYQFLLSKQRDLIEKEKTNTCLGVVKNEYKKFYQILMREKEEQMVNLKAIYDYIQYIIKTGELMPEDIERSKNDLDDILKELRKIRDRLKGMKNTVGFIESEFYLTPKNNI
jgi:hypothetical protein